MEKPLSGSGTHKPTSGEHRGSSRRPGGRSGSHSPGSGEAGAGGSRGSAQGSSSALQLQQTQTQTQTQRRQLEGVLSKYTNLIQGWQNRYFVVDSELGQLQYFINEQGKSQKPRGSLPLIGASVTASDEAPHMFMVHAVNGELYKLRAADAKEQQFWMNHLQACARRYSDSSAKGSSSSGRTRSFSLLPHLTPSSSPSSQRHPGHASSPSNIVSITHHKSPAAARRAKIPYPGRLLEVKEVMSQAEGQQKNLVQSIDSLPTKGPLSCLDQDLLLLKATSAATLSCLGECLNILQQTQSGSQGPPASQHNHGARSDGAPVWTVPKSPSGEQLKNGGLTPLRSARLSPALRKRSLSRGAERHSGLEDIDPAEEVTDTEDNEEEDLGVLDDQRSVILHLLSQLKLGMDLTRVRPPNPAPLPDHPSGGDAVNRVSLVGGVAHVYPGEAIPARNVRQLHGPPRHVPVHHHGGHGRGPHCALCGVLPDGVPRGPEGRRGQEALQPRSGGDLPLLLGGSSGQSPAPGAVQPGVGAGAAQGPQQLPAGRGPAGGLLQGPVCGRAGVPPPAGVGLLLRVSGEEDVRQRPRVDQEQVHGDVDRGVHGRGRWVSHSFCRTCQGFLSFFPTELLLNLFVILFYK
uniref:Oxysterol binding protein like 10 n=1 Tax=Oryzias melastigma TaxID=30732 RepID=A0A3B3D8J9_ORYME